MSKVEVLDEGIVPTNAMTPGMKRLLDMVLPSSMASALEANRWSIEDEVKRLISIASQDDNYSAALGALAILRERIMDSLRLANVIRKREYRHELVNPETGEKLITTEEMSQVAGGTQSSIRMLEAANTPHVGGQKGESNEPSVDAEFTVHPSEPNARDYERGVADDDGATSAGNHAGNEPAAVPSQDVAAGEGRDLPNAVAASSGPVGQESPGRSDDAGAGRPVRQVVADDVPHQPDGDGPRHDLEP